MVDVIYESAGCGCSGGSRLAKIVFDCGEITAKYNSDTPNNLNSVILPNGDDIEYIIDGQNRRIGKMVKGYFVTGWLYQDQLNPVAEVDSFGNIITRFVYGSRAHVPDYLIRDSVVYRYVTDHLGSVRFLVNLTTGEIVQEMEYDEFGKVLKNTNESFQPFTYAGGLNDNQTGLIRFGARDYDATVGRWTAKDPIGFYGDDVNIYQYVKNDPMTYLDNSGLYGREVHFYKTLEWAYNSGFTANEAIILAYSNQGVDEGFSHSVWPRAFKKHFPDKSKLINQLHGAIECDNLIEFGKLLHSLQDSFAHEGSLPYPIGHLPWPWFDDYNPNSFRDQNMEWWTKYFMNLYLERNRK